MSTINNQEKPMICTHCRKQLADPNAYRKSAEIPGKPEHYYGLCGCGNVMVLSFKGDELTGVEPTGQTSDEETDRMIIEAAELFTKAGARQGVYGYTKDDNRQNVSDLKQKYNVPEEPEDVVDNYSARYEQDHRYEPQEARMGFWKRLWARIAGAFK